MPSKTPLSDAFLFLLVTLSVASCGGGGDGTGPDPEPPVITVQGVEDGQVAEGAVTPVISVSPAGATYQASLNDEPFFSGTTVSRPGSYVLEVVATNDGLTVTETVSFEIRFAGSSVLIVRMFDLGANDAGGGGDAILLTDSSAAGMRHFMIDAGPAGASASDPGFVQDRLEALGVDTLQALLLTHAHTDHFQGMPAVLNGTTVEEFIYNGQVRSFSRYTSLLSLAEQRAEQVTIPSAVTSHTLGYGSDPTVLEVVPPLPDHVDDDTDDGSDLNDGSLGAALTKGAFRMFFTGDGEVDANLRWRTAFSSLSVALDALKVGHHGANDATFDPASSSSSPWLAHTDAELQLVSANGTSHPLSRAISALLGQTTETYCTNVHGDIEVRVDAAGTWVVGVERNAGVNCIAGG